MIRDSHDDGFGASVILRVTNHELRVTIVKIDYTESLKEIVPHVCEWCDASTDATELIRSAERAAMQNSEFISADPDSIRMLWSWLEKTKVSILARVPFEPVGSKMSERMNAVFKSGASGVQLFCAAGDLSSMVDILMPVTNDLFFGRKLFVALDASEIGPFDWDVVFAQLRRCHADGVLLSNADAGKTFGMLDSGSIDKFALHFKTSTPSQTEDIFRLVQKMMPGALTDLKFFQITD